ncbi:nuclear transport factor 2 family protein [Hyphococcus flavus]|uniref:Nuclear transport factor 2 family protein n=1 Tax=Hyphococcus flavus TaxID=1866326 RepID=A0AAF0CBU2_9PROT|nr:nuclear transport factor 2 family protein [Hyphococcus flavus]WDI31840.1 nuclear transport factor 2 family protein [Hyphococcus flavus]
MSDNEMRALHTATALLTEFANAVDQGDLKQLGQLFCADATMDLPALSGDQKREVLQGREAILARWRGDRPFASRHIVGNIAVVCNQADRIDVKSTGIGIRGPKEGGAPFLIVVADYKDTLQHSDGNWRFRSRVVSSVFSWAAEPR